MPTVQIPEAFDFLFQDEARYRASYGGRGSAKSHSFAFALVVKARERPLRILCAREIQKSIRDSVKRLLDDKIEEAGFRGFFQSTDTEIRGANGSLFLFAGLRTNADAVKSTEGIDIAWVEEANKVSQRSLDLLIPTIRKPGSEIWFTWNPEHPTDPVDAMFRGKAGPPPRSLVRQVNWDDNPFFPPVLQGDMEWDRQRDPEKFAHIWGGAYLRNSEARVFKNWRVEEFETPPDARFYFGADWGFSVDPTVLVRAFIVGRTLFVDREAYKVGVEIDRTPALFDTIPGSRRWPITADSSRPETISYMQHHGFGNVGAALKGAGSVEDGIEFLKNYDIVVHPDCRHTADELTFYSWKVDPLTGEVLPVLADKHNHVIDALRYAVEGLRRNTYDLLGAV
jgi:phage terminase large subunit